MKLGDNISCTVVLSMLEIPELNTDYETATIRRMFMPRVIDRTPMAAFFDYMMPLKAEIRNKIYWRRYLL